MADHNGSVNGSVQKKGEELGVKILKDECLYEDESVYVFTVLGASVSKNCMLKSFACCGK